MRRERKAKRAKSHPFEVSRLRSSASWLIRQASLDDIGLLLVARVRPNSNVCSADVTYQFSTGRFAEWSEVAQSLQASLVLRQLLTAVGLGWFCSASERWCSSACRSRASPCSSASCHGLKPRGLRHTWPIRQLKLQPDFTPSALQPDFTPSEASHTEDGEWASLWKRTL